MSRLAAALLLVEPDPVTRAMYVRELARTWRVLDCGDHTTARAYLAGEQISAVVLEPIMPDGETWSLVAVVRANPVTAEIPIVICSVVSDRGPGLALGASAHLVKPVSPQQLVKEVACRLSAHTDAHTSK